MLNRVLLMHMNTWRETVMKPFFNDAQWWNLRQWTQTYTGDCLSTRKYFFPERMAKHLQRLPRRLWRYSKFVWTQSCATEEAGQEELWGSLPISLILWFSDLLHRFDMGKKMRGKKYFCWTMFFCSTLIYRADIT